MKREPSRVRVQGTVVTEPQSPEERIAAIRQVVDRKQYAKIDGVMMDLFTASHIIAVYDNLSEPNQAKYAACHTPKMARIAFQLLK